MQARTGVGGTAISLARTRWEAYGPHHDDPSQIWTEVSWLLSSLAVGRTRERR